MRDKWSVYPKALAPLLSFLAAQSLCTEDVPHARMLNEFPGLRLLLNELPGLRLFGVRLEDILESHISYQYSMQEIIDPRYAQLKGLVPTGPTMIIVKIILR